LAPGRGPRAKRAHVGLLASLAVLIGGCAVTPPSPGFPVAFPPTVDDHGNTLAIVGDLQMTPWFVRTVMRRESNRDAQTRLIADLRVHIDELAALAIVGDLVFNARSDSDWRHFDDVIAPVARRVPVLPAIGNHDYPCRLVRVCRQDEIAPRFLARFPWFAPGRTYVVPYGDIALVFVDSETSLAAQGEWLRAWARTHAHEYVWAIVMLHRPPHTDSELPDVAPDPELGEHIVTALAGTTLVPVFVSGHAHGYEHHIVEGTHFIVTAGGGGPRGKLRSTRPYDVYAGPDCQRDDSGRVLRPLNYVLVQPGTDALEFTVRGFCKSDADVDVLETFSIPRPARR
jgi:Calcineurin-like phosphoesterase